MMMNPIKISAALCLSLLVSITGFAEPILTRDQMLKVVNAVLASKNIVQNFPGASAQTVTIGDADIIISKTKRGGFRVQIDANNETIKDLSVITLDGVTLDQILKNSDAYSAETKSLRVLQALLNSTQIQQKFEGDLSSQTRPTAGAPISVKFASGSESMIIQVGAYNRSINDLETVLVDGVSVKRAIKSLKTPEGNLAQTLAILAVLNSSKVIEQRFERGGSYQVTNTVDTKVEIVPSDDGKSFSIHIGANNPSIQDLAMILVDGVPLNKAIENRAALMASRTLAMKVITALSSAKVGIEQSFGTLVSKQTIADDDLKIIVKQNPDKQRFEVAVGTHNSPIQVLDNVKVDGVSLKTMVLTQL